MNRTVAPASARAFALISVILTVLALVACVGIILMQGMLKTAFSGIPEIQNTFVFPGLTFFCRFLPALLQVIFGILVLAGGRKPVWTKGKAVAFAVVLGVTFGLFDLLGMPLATLESQLVAMQGSMNLAAYSVVNAMLGWGYTLLRYSAVACFVSVSVLTYRAALDAKAQMPPYFGGNT